MATRRKQLPLRGDGRDGLDYRAFVDGLCAGSIRATVLVDTTVPDGTRDIVVQKIDANGDRLPDVVVTVSTRRLIKLEYDDPNG
jgi:hypothetical protein